MADRKDYYRILHVQRDAPAEVIRSSYRTMMQKLRMHPDLGGDHKAAALINEAFAVLNDPAARAEYDARTASESDPARSPDGAHSDGVRSSDIDENEDRDGDGADHEESPPEPDQFDTNDHCLFCAARCRSMQLREPDDVCGNCAAPLYPAKHRRFEVDSQRAIERIPRQTSAAFSLRSGYRPQHQGLVHDISLNGMQLRTFIELKRDQIVLIRTDVLDAVARVVDSRMTSAESAGSWRVGLVFLTMKLHRSRGSFVSVDV
jgi:curved DNA-binding protein CbpA